MTAQARVRVRVMRPFASMGLAWRVGDVYEVPAALGFPWIASGLVQALDPERTAATLSAQHLFGSANARFYLESRRWPSGPICPECLSAARITMRQGGYRCKACALDFTVRTGTIFERPRVSLHKWISAMYFLVTSRAERDAQKIPPLLDAVVDLVLRRT